MFAQPVKDIRHTIQSVTFSKIWKVFKLSMVQYCMVQPLTWPSIMKWSSQLCVNWLTSYFHKSTLHFLRWASTVNEYWSRNGLICHYAQARYEAVDPKAPWPVTHKSPGNCFLQKFNITISIRTFKPLSHWLLCSDEHQYSDGQEQWSLCCWWNGQLRSVRLLKVEQQFWCRKWRK